MAIARALISGIRWSSLSTLILTVLNMVQVLILVRYLSTADFALAALAGIYFNVVATLQESGINAAIVQQPDAGKEQLSTLYWLNVLIALLLFLMALPSGWLMSRFYGQPQLGALLLFYCSGILIYGFGVQYSALLQRKMAFQQLAMIEASGVVAGFLPAVVMGIYGFGAWAIITGYVIRFAVRTLGFILVGRRYFQLAFIFDLRSVSGYLDFGRFHLAERITTLIVSQLDVILIGKLLGANALGVYDVFKRVLVKPSSLIAQTVERVAFPVLSKVQGRPSVLRAVYLNLLNAQCALQFPIYLPLLVLAPWLVPLLLGEEWLNYLPEFRWLVVFVLLHMILNPIDSLLLAVNKIQGWWYANLILGPFLALGIWLGHFGQLKGVIIGMAIAYLLLIIGSFYFLLKGLLAVTAGTYFQSILVPLAVTVVTMAPFAGLLWLGPEDWLAAGYLGLIFAGLYLLASRYWNPQFIKNLYHLGSGRR